MTMGLCRGLLYEDGFMVMLVDPAAAMIHSGRMRQGISGGTRKGTWRTSWGFSDRTQDGVPNIEYFVSQNRTRQRPAHCQPFLQHHTAENFQPVFMACHGER